MVKGGKGAGCRLDLCDVVQVLSWSSWFFVVLNSETPTQKKKLEYQAKSGMKSRKNLVWSTQRKHLDQGSGAFPP